MVRLYGDKPYSVVLVHGGSGAIGSLKGFAEKYAKGEFYDIILRVIS